MSTTTTSTSSTSYIDSKDGRNKFIVLFNEYILLLIILVMFFSCIFLWCRSLVNSYGTIDTPLIYDNISEFPDEISIDILVKNKCSICLEEFNNEKILMTHCQHVYHYNCIKEWKTKSNDFTCPLCRNVIQKVYEI